MNFYWLHDSLYTQLECDDSLVGVVWRGALKVLSVESSLRWRLTLGLQAGRSHAALARNQAPPNTLLTLDLIIDKLTHALISHEFRPSKCTYIVSCVCLCVSMCVCWTTNPWRDMVIILATPAQAVHTHTHTFTWIQLHHTHTHLYLDKSQAQ